MLLLFGGILLFLGLLLVVAPNLPALGKLPGDFRIERGSFTLYLPLASSLFLSLILTILFNLFLKK